MMTPCARIREHLSAYVDGELERADRLVVSQHLTVCASCEEVQQAIRYIGEGLRAGARPASQDLNLQGLAAGIISRTSAEESQSWRAWFTRAVEDWHWALAGAGSLVMAAASILLVAAICGLGPGPIREDSLAAMLNNLHTPAGTLLIIATPAGPDQVPLLLQFDNGEAGNTSEPAELPAGFSSPSGSALALELLQALEGPDGRMYELSSMSRPLREHAEALMDDIQRVRTAPQVSWSGRRISIQKMGFVTNTSVSGKAL